MYGFAYVFQLLVSHQVMKVEINLRTPSYTASIAVDENKISIADDVLILYLDI